MIKMEAYSYKWNEFLKSGKVMGMKCNDCGGYEFPPVPICNECGKTSMDWAEMSGEAEMLTCGFGPMGIYPFKDDPVVTLGIKLKEGPPFMSWLSEGDQDTVAEILAMPKPVKLMVDIQQLDENIWWPAFRVV